MAKSLNKVMLIGRLGKDPEIKYTVDGQAYTKFSLATSDTYKGKDGNYVVRKRFLNTSLLCMLMLMIGYSSYAIIVIRSAQNPPMDQNSPDNVFTLGSYMGR